VASPCKSKWRYFRPIFRVHFGVLNGEEEDEEDEEDEEEEEEEEEEKTFGGSNGSHMSTRPTTVPFS